MSLQSFASHRLVTIGLAFCLGSALACYSDKPGTTSRSSHATAGDSGLGLQPIPATHDTAIREVDSFALTPEVIQHWTTAKQSMDSVIATDPAIVRRLKSESVPKGIAEMGARLEADPKLAQALKGAHTDGHAYMLTTVALQQAIRGYQLKTAGQLNTTNVPPTVMQNIDYVAAHLQQLMQAMRGSSRGLPVRPR